MSHDMDLTWENDSVYLHLQKWLPKASDDIGQMFEAIVSFDLWSPAGELVSMKKFVMNVYKRNKLRHSCKRRCKFCRTHAASSMHGNDVCMTCLDVLLFEPFNFV